MAETYTMEEASKNRGRGQAPYKAAGFKSQKEFDKFLEKNPKMKHYFED